MSITSRESWIEKCSMSFSSLTTEINWWKIWVLLSACAISNTDTHDMGKESILPFSCHNQYIYVWIWRRPSFISLLYILFYSFTFTCFRAGEKCSCTKEEEGKGCPRYSFFTWFHSNLNKHLWQCFNLLFLCSKASESFNRPATHPV